MKAFYIRSKIIGDIVMIYPKGHLDAHNVERFEKEILKHIGGNHIRIAGSALIVEKFSTTFLKEKWFALVDAWGNLVLEREP